MKTVEENDRYFIIEWEFEGMPIYIRQWKHEDVTEIKVDNKFARANGFKSVKDMARKTIGQAKFNQMFGGVPEWIRATPHGDFFFVGVDRTKIN